MRIEEQMKWERRSRWFWLVLALFYTAPAIISLFPVQHLAWLNAPRTWQGRIALWGVATFFWLLYVTRPNPHGRAALPGAILLAISPAFILHYLRLFWGAVLFWCMAAILVIQHFARPRRRTAALTAAILMTALPIFFGVYQIDRHSQRLRQRAGAVLGDCRCDVGSVFPPAAEDDCRGRRMLVRAG